MTDLLEKEIHVGDTVLRARTYKSTGVLWSIHKVVGIMNTPKNSRTDQSSRWGKHNKRGTS